LKKLWGDGIEATGFFVPTMVVQKPSFDHEVKQGGDE
jgi:hypothetical protein